MWCNTYSFCNGFFAHWPRVLFVGERGGGQVCPPALWGQGGTHLSQGSVWWQADQRGGAPPGFFEAGGRDERQAPEAVRPSIPRICGWQAQEGPKGPVGVMRGWPQTAKRERERERERDRDRDRKREGGGETEREKVEKTNKAQGRRNGNATAP